MTTSVTLFLPGERPVSWNVYYGGKHWTQRQREAQRVHALVRAALDPEQAPFAGPVNITLIAFFSGRPLDPDNICAKLYIDGLKGWLIADDDRRHVRSVRVVSEVDRANPRLEIEVRPAEDGALRDKLIQAAIIWRETDGSTFEVTSATGNLNIAVAEYVRSLRHAS